jgi:hypothetical protein
MITKKKTVMRARGRSQAQVSANYMVIMYMITNKITIMYMILYAHVSVFFQAIRDLAAAAFSFGAQEFMAQTWGGDDVGVLLEHGVPVCVFAYTWKETPTLTHSPDRA